MKFQGYIFCVQDACKPKNWREKKPHECKAHTLYVFEMSFYLSTYRWQSPLPELWRFRRSSNGPRF